MKRSLAAGRVTDMPMGLWLGLGMGSAGSAGAIPPEGLDWLEYMPGDYITYGNEFIAGKA